MKKYKKLWLGITSIGLAVLVFIVLMLIQQSVNKKVTYDEMLVVNATETTEETAEEAYLQEYDGYECLTWVSISIKELYEGVAGTLREGDYIDIYTVWKEGEEVCSQRLAEHVRIKETFNAQGVQIEDEKEGLSQLIVVPIEKEQVSVFYEMLAKGNIRIAKYEET